MATESSSEQAELPLTKEASEEPPVPKQVSVKVSNISSATTIKDLHTHFSFAGTISSIHLQPGSKEAPGTAHLTFLEPKALENALLLSDSSVKGSLLKVDPAEEGYSPPIDSTFYAVGPPPKSAGAVKVTGLGTGTAIRDLQELFACAGPISSISLLPGADGQPGEAHVGLYEAKGLDTALLLTDAKLKGSVVKVEMAPGYEPPPTAKLFPPPKQVGAAQSPVQQAEALMRRLVEQGMSLGAATAQKAKEIEEKHQLTRIATSKAIQLRDSAAAAVSDLQKRFTENQGAMTKPLEDGVDHVDKSITNMDEQLKLSEKAQGVFTSAERQLADFGSYLMQNKYLSQGRDLLMGTAAKISEAVEGGAAQSTPGSAPGAAAATDASAAGSQPPPLSLSTPLDPDSVGVAAGGPKEEDGKPSKEVDPLLGRKKGAEEAPLDVSSPAGAAAPKPSESSQSSSAPKGPGANAPAPNEDDTPVF